MIKEKCLLVGIDNYYNDIDIDSSMEELEELIRAVDGEVVSTIVQKRQNIDNKFYIGKGKVEEISTYVDELEIDTVIFNGELSGSQIKNIEDAINCKVIDRTMLILDIFAKRATTNEGKLQVELAQLKYRLPRIIGVGKSLSRQGGGIGTRGPGEKKIETDRRHILKRINDIEKQLSKTEKSRDLKRKKRNRNNVPLVSIVGYTNAGKSTLLNTLINNNEVDENKKVYADDLLFATLETEIRRIQLPGGNTVVFSDTVGFVRDLPTQIVEAFKGTLEEIVHADLILHVMDINDKNLIENKKVTMDIVNDIVKEDMSIIEVYNKIDLSDHEEYNNDKQDDKVFISAKNNENIKHLLEVVDYKLFGDKISCKMNIPREDINIYYQLYDNRKVLEVTHEENYIAIEVIIYQYEREMYENYIQEVQSIE